jgi:hypothetical protein
VGIFANALSCETCSYLFTNNLYSPVDVLTPATHNTDNMCIVYSCTVGRYIGNGWKYLVFGSVPRARG